MSPLHFAFLLIGYLGVLLCISWFTARKANTDSYFLGNKQSPWYAVALGMIGDSLSGLTFISVPGAVYSTQFGYMQLVVGYFLGYFIITHALLPLYYRLQLTSIYSFLALRLGQVSQRTGSAFFILSRLMGAGGRLFLAGTVLQTLVFDSLGIPFPLAMAGIIALMLVYTVRGGIKTLVWTDAFQSTVLLGAVVASVWAVASHLNFSFSDALGVVAQSAHSQWLVTDVLSKQFIGKQLLGGLFIAVAMTGLDQNMMQKNLSMRTLPDAQKNMFWFSVTLVFVNLFFVGLGALLLIYAKSNGLALPIANGQIITDEIFPFLALNHLGTVASIAFVLGLIAATFSSADSVLTSLTTAFVVDFGRGTDGVSTTNRRLVHALFALLLLLVIVGFRWLGQGQAVIYLVLTVAGYTYGPLLGLFGFAMLTQRKPNERWVPIICVSAPALCYLLQSYSPQWLGGYQFGHEILLLNGALTFAGLWLSSRTNSDHTARTTA